MMRSFADGILIVAILVSGAAAAYIAMPGLWIITPLMVLFVRYSARREMGYAAEEATVRIAPDFPPELQQLIDSISPRLRWGDARSLLANVVRQARPLFAQRESSFDDLTEADTRVEIIDLVRASCETALELARLDVAAPGAGDGPLMERYQKAREQLVVRLEDAATALGEMYASSVEHGTVASDRVGELASDVRADARARKAALGELLSS